MIEEAVYLIPSLSYDPQLECFVLYNYEEGKYKSGFYGAIGTEIVTGTLTDFHDAEEALLKEIKKRTIRKSEQAIKMAHNLVDLLSNLECSGMKKYTPTHFYPKDFEPKD